MCMLRFHRLLAVAGLSALLLGAGCSDPNGERDLRAGLRELKRENFVRAKALLEKSIARRPGHIDNARTHNYLGMAAWGLKQYGEAMTAFEDSRRLNPNLIEPVYNMGVLSAERDDFRGAARFLNEAASMDRQDPRALEYLAELYLQRGQWSQARNVLYTALDREPRSARIYNAIAAAHVGMQQPEQAIESLMLALETDARYAPALLNLGVVYDTLVGDAEQARNYYKRFLSAASRDERAGAARDALNRLEARGAAVTARPVSSPAPVAPVEPGAPPAVEPPAPVVAATNAPSTPAPTPVPAPTPAPAPQQSTAHENFMKQAADRARAGQVQQAIDLYVRAAESAAAERRIDLQENAYREAVRAAIDQPRAHALLGQHLYERGRYDQAAQSFRTAATLSADYAPAQLGLARLAARNNEVDAAVVHYRRVMTSDPTLGDAFWEFAQLYDQQLGLPENAARAYREFAANFPNDKRRANALARAEELAPTPRPAAPTAAAVPDVAPGAREAVARRLDYRPPATRNVQAGLQAFNRAVQFHNQQNWEQAIFFYLRSLENDDQQARTFYNLGICYTMNGQRTEARDAYRQAIRLQPGLRDAQYNLALLYRDSGDETSATRLLEEIIKAEPGYAAAHYLLGSIYAASPRTRAQARQHYERFLTLAPNDRSAPAIREWLQNN